MKNAKKTILIVEDSPVQAQAVMALLKHRNVSILCAANGEAGLEMARQNMPEVILLDVEMPGMSGLEVCRLLRDDTGTANIPVILFTTRTDQETVREGLVDGAVEYIPKDRFFEPVLLATLKEMNLFEPSAAPHSI